MVLLRELAVQLGIDRSNLRKYVLKIGMRPHFARENGRGQKMLCLSDHEANRLFVRRAADGFYIP